MLQSSNRIWVLGIGCLAGLCVASCTTSEDGPKLGLSGDPVSQDSSGEDAAVASGEDAVEGASDSSTGSPDGSPPTNDVGTDASAGGGDTDGDAPGGDDPDGDAPDARDPGEGEPPWDSPIQCTAGWCWVHPQPQGHDLYTAIETADGARWAFGERGAAVRWDSASAEVSLATVGANDWGITARCPSGAAWVGSTNSGAIAQFVSESEWSIGPSLPTAGATQLACGAGDVLWAVGTNQTLYSRVGQRWSPAPTPGREPLAAASVVATGSGAVWVAATDGAIWRWESSEWAEMPGAGLSGALSLKARGDVVWALGDGGLAQWLGDEWTLSDLGAQGPWTDFWPSEDGAEVWLVDGSGSLARYYLTTQQLFSASDKTEGEHTALFGGAQGPLWALGRGGAIWEWTGEPTGVAVWSERTRSVTRDAIVQRCHSFESVWIVDDQARVHQYDGTDWHTRLDSNWLDVPAGALHCNWEGQAWLARRWYPDEDQLPPANGELIHWDGEEWTPQVLPDWDPLACPLVAVKGIESVTMWAVDQCGGVYRHSGEGTWARVGDFADQGALFTSASWVSSDGNLWIAGASSLIRIGDGESVVIPLDFIPSDSEQLLITALSGLVTNAPPGSPAEYLLVAGQSSGLGTFLAEWREGNWIVNPTPGLPSWAGRIEGNPAVLSGGVLYMLPPENKWEVVSVPIASITQVHAELGGTLWVFGPEGQVLKSAPTP